MFACDFIVARDDAIVMDHHMGGTFMGTYEGQRMEGGHEYANVPGDGGAALIPFLMSPCKAKEYLMLAQSYTAAELARMGIINYAVPAAELDAKVNDLVKRLLQRGAYALARTKRLANRGLARHLNLTLDAAAAYEMVSQLQPNNIDALG
jgi:enoyl-CoA hydratase